MTYSAAVALGHYTDDPEALQGLLKLTDDADGDLRDWAIFNLGVIGSINTSEIRDALLARLSDAHPDAREETTSGLAKRRDERVSPALLQALSDPGYTDRLLEAASLMLGRKEVEYGDPREYLASLRERFGNGTETSA